MFAKVEKILSDLVNIPSYGNIKEDHPIIQYLMTSFQSCCEIRKFFDEQGGTHLLIGVNTALDKVGDCILLSGHIDTVHPSTEHDAVAITKNDSIKGLGVSDMKCFWASIISNLEALKKISFPIVLSITSDEESDFYGIETLTDEMKKLKITPKFVIVGEPTDSSLSFSSRGNSIFISQMLGKACHSSKPELGINAILLSMQMVNALEEISFQNKNDISISVVDIQGGQAPNIIPDYCQMRFSIRSTNVRKLNEVKKMLYQKHKGIEKVSGSALINVLDIPPYKCEKTIFIQNFMNKNNIKSSEQDYTTEAGVIQQKFNDAEIVIFGPGDPQNIHKKGESICISRLQQYTKLLLNFIEDYPMRVKVCNKGPHSNRKEEFCR